MKTLLVIFQLLAFLTVSSYSSLQAQNGSLDTLSNIIVQAHSNLGAKASFVVVKKDTAALTLDIKSLNKTSISEIEESFVLDLNNISDIFSIPMGVANFRVIVNLKEKILITTKTTEYENLFHEEISKEDIREESDIWFVFSEESQAEKFEKAILQLKKELTQQ